MYPTKVWAKRDSFTMVALCKAGPWFLLGVVAMMVVQSIPISTRVTGMEKGAGLVVALVAAICGLVKVVRLFVSWTFGTRFDMLTFRVMHANDPAIRWCDLKQVTFHFDPDELIEVICEFRTSASPLTICCLAYDEFAQSKMWDAFRRAALSFRFNLSRVTV